MICGKQMDLMCQAKRNGPSFTCWWQDTCLLRFMVTATMSELAIGKLITRFSARYTPWRCQTLWQNWFHDSRFLRNCTAKESHILKRVACWLNQMEFVCRSDTTIGWHWELARKQNHGKDDVVVIFDGGPDAHNVARNLVLHDTIRSEPLHYTQYWIAYQH